MRCWHNLWHSTPWALLKKVLDNLMQSKIIFQDAFPDTPEKFYSVAGRDHYPEVFFQICRELGLRRQRRHRHGGHAGAVRHNPRCHEVGTQFLLVQIRNELKKLHSKSISHY